MPQKLCQKAPPGLGYLPQVEDEEEEQEQPPSSSGPGTQAPNTRGTKRGRAVHQAQMTVPRRPLLENAGYGSSGGVQVSGAELVDLPANTVIPCTEYLKPDESSRLSRCTMLTRWAPVITRDAVPASATAECALASDPPRRVLTSTASLVRSQALARTSPPD